MKTSVRSEDQAAELLEQLGHAVAGAGQRHGLTAAQWAALRFFGRANRFSRTVSSFAAFHATTRGTASQTVGRLVDRGFLQKYRSAIDGRSHRLDLTDKGRTALADDPLKDLVSALRSLAPGTRDQFVNTLRRLVADVARLRGSPTFGTCPTCAYLDCHRRYAEDVAGRWCNLFDEPLDIAEVEQLCVNYMPASAGSPKQA